MKNKNIHLSPFIKKSLFVLLIIPFIYLLSGCFSLGEISTAINPNSSRAEKSFIVWDKDSKKIYFLRVDMPFRCEIRKSAGMEMLKSSLTSECHFDNSRPCDYTLVKLDILKKRGHKRLVLSCSAIKNWKACSPSQPQLVYSAYVNKLPTIFEVDNKFIANNYPGGLESDILINGTTEEDLLNIEEKNLEIFFQAQLKEQDVIYSNDRCWSVRWVGEWLVISNDVKELTYRINIDNFPRQQPALSFSPDDSKLAILDTRIFIIDLLDFSVSNSL